MPFCTQILDHETSLDLSETDLHKNNDNTKESGCFGFLKNKTLKEEDSWQYEVDYSEEYAERATKGWEALGSSIWRSTFELGELSNVVESLKALVFVYRLLYGIASEDQSEPVAFFKPTASAEEEVKEIAAPAEAVVEEAEFEVEAQDKYEHFDLRDEHKVVVEVKEKHQDGCLVSSPCGALRLVSEDSLEMIHNEGELLNNAETNGLTDEDSEFILGAPDAKFAVHDKILDAGRLLSPCPDIGSPSSKTENDVADQFGEQLVQVHAVSEDQSLNLVGCRNELFAVPADDLMPIDNEDLYTMVNDEAENMTDGEKDMVLEEMFDKEPAKFAVLFYTADTWNFEAPADTKWFHVASEEEADPIEEHRSESDAQSWSCLDDETSDDGSSDGGNRSSWVIAKPVDSVDGWKKLQDREGEEKWFSTNMLPAPFNMDDEDITEYTLDPEDEGFCLEDPQRDIYLLDALTWRLDALAWREGDEAGDAPDAGRQSFTKEFAAQQPTFVDL